MTIPEVLAATYSGKSGYLRPATATTEVLVLPAEMIGAWCWFHNESDVTVYLRFADSDTITVDEATATTITGAGTSGDAGTLAASASEPTLVVPAGETRHMFVESQWTHFAHKSGASPTGDFHFGSAQGSVTV